MLRPLPVIALDFNNILLFMSLNCGHQMGLLFITQEIYEYGESRWNYIDRGTQNSLDRNLSQCHCVHQKSRMA
jgi:hypothetical protein